MHTSLDQALGRQPRLNRVGQSLLGISGEAAAAYSLRSLTGGDPRVVNVRRDTGGGAGDDDELEFTASELESGALVDWVGAGNDGFVETWYDQSGNEINATQSALDRQPKIVDSGSYLGKLNFDGTDSLTTSSTISFESAFSQYLASANNAAITSPAIFGRSSGNAYIMFLSGAIQGGFHGNDEKISSVFFTSSAKGYWNNVEILSGFVGSNATATHIGSFSQGGSFLTGHIRELVMYSGDKSDKRIEIQDNINNKYNIY